jgi:hypothetical protein
MHDAPFLGRAVIVFSSLLTSISLSFIGFASPALDAICGVEKGVTTRMFGVVACVRGPVDAEARLSKIELNTLRRRSPRILFVDSGGGAVDWTIEIAEALQPSVLVVVLGDRCMSSCANYLVGLGKLAILGRNSIVGFHGGPPRNFEDFKRQLVWPEEAKDWSRDKKLEYVQASYEGAQQSSAAHLKFFKGNQLQDTMIYAIVDHFEIVKSMTNERRVFILLSTETMSRCLGVTFLGESAWHDPGNAIAVAKVGNRAFVRLLDLEKEMCVVR